MPTRHPFDLAVFFFIDTAPTEIYTLSLHDALPISARLCARPSGLLSEPACLWRASWYTGRKPTLCWRKPFRSEEHTSELQSRRDLVCRLLLEKKKKNIDKELRPHKEKDCDGTAVSK